MNNLVDQLRMAKIELKALKEQNREESKQSKNQHESIVKCEERCKKITNMIKDQKSKNTTNRSNANSMVTDEAKYRLEEELKELDENKMAQEKKYK